MNKEYVILVNTQDEEIGSMEKMDAHRQGLLHRAFSIFVFNNEGQLLIHRRAHEKYHSAGLWTNTCCSHPRHGETTIDAAYRRLQEEMGFTCPLEKSFEFLYKTELEDGLFEHEFDHVFTGEFSGIPNINPEEVSEWKYISITDLEMDVLTHPEKYTVWFRIALPRIIEQIKHVA
jgi:isopentenyl-diphosphate delta-isomerase